MKNLCSVSRTYRERTERVTHNPTESSDFETMMVLPRYAHAGQRAVAE
jgi:hypothetical protein